MKFILIGLFMVSTAFAAGTTAGRAYFYQCECLKGDDQCNDSFSLLLKGKDATISRQTSEGADDSEQDYDGKLDETYAPRQNKNYVRYEGFKGFDEEWGMWLLVEKDLLKGGRLTNTGKDRWGYIKVQARGEGFATSKMVCIRPSKK